MTAKSFPARVHILLARDKPLGLVIRRGPSRSTCILQWDRTRHRFTVSQWLRGRIYERRSDLSPDGSHWIYFAMNGRWSSPAKGAWTAVAQAPWLKAQTLLAKGDCWHGGGLFLSNRTYWLNNGYGHQVLQDDAAVRRDPTYAPSTIYGGECTSVYYNRLQRDGWALLQQHNHDRLNATAIFEKPLRHGWVIQKIAHEQVGAPRGKSCYWDEHRIINSAGEISSKPDWEWAEWVDDRLFWCERGQLFACSVTRKPPLGAAELVHDFNPYCFESLAAPY